MKLLCILLFMIPAFAGCDGAFSNAVEAYRKPVNALPNVSLQIPAGMIPSGTIISGTATDADNDTLLYSWSEVTSFGLTFTNHSGSTTEIIFTGNENRDVVANAVIRLSVSDGEDSVSSEGSIQVYRTDILYMTVDGTGTGNAPDNPRSGDFNSALSYAQSLNKKALAIAAGTYTVTFPSSHIVLIDRVDLYGGYETVNWNRDITTYTTSITDTSHYVNSTQSAIYAGNNITEDIEINGLTITSGTGSTQANAAAIVIDDTTGGTVTVTRCTITSQGNNTYLLHGILIWNADTHIVQNFINLKSITESSAGNNAIAHGITKFQGGSCLISNNTIFGGFGVITDSSNPNTFGIYIDDSNTGKVTIRNNCINAGVSDWTVYGISIRNSTDPNAKVYIQNNTIYAAGASYAYGICIMISTVYINNNIILMYNKTGTGTTVPVFELASGTSPVSINNNNLYIINDPTPIYYHDYDHPADVTNFITVMTSPNGSLLDFGNLNEDLLTYDFFESFGGDDGDPNTMDDNNWRIRNNSNTTNIRYGGIDLSLFTDGSNPDYISFSSDKDGNERTAVSGSIASNNNAAGWTIGAYESD